MITNFKNTNTNKNILIKSILSAIIFIQLIGISVQVKAETNQTADLIIGQEQSASKLIVSLCVKSTSGKITLANVSNWLQYDKNSLSPESSIVEKGAYGNSNNGYSALKWQKVQGVEDKYTLSLGFNGDGQTSGQSGIEMQSSTPELFGKVGFDIVGNSKSIKLDKNLYYSIENPKAPVTMNIKNIAGDCRIGITSLPNPIEKISDQVQTISVNKNQAQDNITNYDTSTTKLSIQNEIESQKSNLNQSQLNYDSVRTGGINLSFFYIIISIIATLIYKTLKKSKIKYFKI